MDIQNFLLHNHQNTIRSTKSQPLSIIKIGNMIYVLSGTASLVKLHTVPSHGRANDYTKYESCV